MIKSLLGVWSKVTGCHTAHHLQTGHCCPITEHGSTMSELQHWGCWVRSGKLPAELTQCIEFIWISWFFQGSTLHSVSPLHMLIEVCCKQFRLYVLNVAGTELNIKTQLAQTHFHELNDTFHTTKWGFYSIYNKSCSFQKYLAANVFLNILFYPVECLLFERYCAMMKIAIFLTENTSMVNIIMSSKWVFPVLSSQQQGEWGKSLNLSQFPTLCWLIIKLKD